MTYGIVTFYILVPLACSTVFAFQLADLYAKELSTVKVFLYSTALPTGIDLQNGESLKHYNASRSLKLVIHGWNSDRNQIAIVPVRNAYLVQNQHNLLMADWSDISYKPYGIARELVQPLGKRIAAILAAFLHRMDIPLRQVHVVGHSLGSHIAGHVGRRFSGKLARITALDPAGVLFSRLSLDAYSKADAQFVDAIHTDGSVLGETISRAHADFYPNSGTGSQPGCELLDTLVFHSCSHYRSTELYAESILQPYNFMARECKVDPVRMPWTPCSGATKSTSTQLIPMGEYVSDSTRGTFYLQTSNLPPYGLGNGTSR